MLLTNRGCCQLVIRDGLRRGLTICFAYITRTILRLIKLFLLSSLVQGSMKKTGLRIGVSVLRSPNELPHEGRTRGFETVPSPDRLNQPCRRREYTRNDNVDGPPGLACSSARRTVRCGWQTSWGFSPGTEEKLDEAFVRGHGTTQTREFVLLDECTDLLVLILHLQCSHSRQRPGPGDPPQG